MSTLRVKEVKTVSSEKLPASDNETSQVQHSHRPPVSKHSVSLGLSFAFLHWQLYWASFTGLFPGCMSSGKTQRGNGNAVCVDLGDSHRVVCVSISLTIVHLKFTFGKCKLHDNKAYF